MDWNENVLAWMATLSGHERKHMIAWSRNIFDSDSYYNVAIDRQVELHDIYLRQFGPTQAELHAYSLADEKSYDVENKRHRSVTGKPLRTRWHVLPE